jgi:hypothetical protein
MSAPSATRTLYVSDLIEPHACKKPGYGKLQVGIYVAAIQNAMDRQKHQLDNTARPQFSDDDGSFGGDGDNDDGDHGQPSGRGHEDRERGKDGSGGGRRDDLGDSGHALEKSGEYQNGEGGENPAVDESVAIRVCLPEPRKPPHEPDYEHQKTIQVANNRNVILLFLPYDIYGSPIPATFLRSAPPIMAGTKFPTPPLLPRDISTYGLDKCLPIVLTSEIGHGATGIVHRGMLQLEGSVPLDTVVKLAFDKEQPHALKDEYEVYHRLRLKGVLRGIMTVLGFSDDCEGGPCALVMLYAGVSLATEPERVLPVSDRWVSRPQLIHFIC